MANLLSILKSIGGPGSIGFLLVAGALALACWRFFPRARSAARIALAGLMGLYLALATPAVATQIVDSLPTFARPGRPPRGGADLLFVLDGDNRVGRVIRAWQLLRSPDVQEVWLLGGPWMLDDLSRPVRPRIRVHHDETTWNTHAQVVRVTQILEQRPGARAAVIASRIQAPRVAALLEAAGTSAVLVPSRLDHELTQTGIWRFLPSLGALSASREAIYGHAALAYYRWQGVIR